MLRFSPEAIQIKRGGYFINRSMQEAKRNALWRYWCLSFPAKYKAVMPPKPFSVRAERRCVKGQLSLLGCLRRNV